MSASRSWRRSAQAALAFTMLAACADLPPVQLAATYAPTAYAPSRSPPSGREPCRVLLAGVKDLRDDPQAAGDLGNRFVHAEDAPAWLRSGVMSLSRDGRLAVSDALPPDRSELTINVDLLKVYVVPINQAKSANVVVRVHYAGPRGPSDDQVYRGTYTSLDWTGMAVEARGALDKALDKALDGMDRGLVSRCGATHADGANARQP